MDLHRVAACCVAGALGLGLPVALAAPAGAGGGCHAAFEEGQTEDAGDTVALVQNCMTPTVLHTSVGTTVTFENTDQVAHNVYGAGWGTDALAPGAVFAHTFDEPGTFPYTCTLHVGMVGAVEVAGDGPSSVATQPVSASSSSAEAAADDGMGLGAVAAVAAVAFGAGAGAVAVRRRRT